MIPDPAPDLPVKRWLQCPGCFSVGYYTVQPGEARVCDSFCGETLVCIDLRGLDATVRERRDA
jgi:hypothetical protein